MVAENPKKKKRIVCFIFSKAVFLTNSNFVLQYDT